MRLTHLVRLSANDGILSKADNLSFHLFLKKNKKKFNMNLYLVKSDRHTVSSTARLLCLSLSYTPGYATTNKPKADRFVNSALATPYTRQVISHADAAVYLRCSLPATRCSLTASPPADHLTVNYRWWSAPRPTNPCGVQLLLPRSFLETRSSSERLTLRKQVSAGGTAEGTGTLLVG